jgi:hypothetical protein
VSKPAFGDYGLKPIVCICQTKKINYGKQTEIQTLFCKTKTYAPKIKYGRYCMKKTKIRKGMLRPGNVVKHKSTGSRWIIVDIQNNYANNHLEKAKSSPTISVSGYCLFTGKVPAYWKVGQIDTWLVDTDREGVVYNFYKMWDVEQ